MAEGLLTQSDEYTLRAALPSEGISFTFGLLDQINSAFSILVAQPYGNVSSSWLMMLLCRPRASAACSHSSRTDSGLPPELAQVCPPPEA